MENLEKCYLLDVISRSLVPCNKNNVGIHKPLYKPMWVYIETNATLILVFYTDLGDTRLLYLELRIACMQTIVITSSTSGDSLSKCKNSFKNF